MAKERHPSWKIGGPWDALKHRSCYDRFSSMENLEFLSDRLLISSLASSSLTLYMHLPEYLAEIVFPPILIDVTWLSDVGQDAP
jgi:hypothetical protein